MEQTSPAVLGPVEPTVMQRPWVDCAAFPVTSDNYADKYCEQGMSLRDYYAGKAMQGMLADLPKTCYGLDWTKNVAKAAFEVADAMMAARAT